MQLFMELLHYNFWFTHSRRFVGGNCNLSSLDTIVAIVRQSGGRISWNRICCRSRGVHWRMKLQGPPNRDLLRGTSQIKQIPGLRNHGEVCNFQGCSHHQATVRGPKLIRSDCTNHDLFGLSIMRTITSL